MKLSADTAEGLLILGLGLGAFWLLWKAKDAIGAGITAAVPYVDPTSDRNLAYQGVNSIVQYLPGADDNSTLGTWAYDITHSSTPAPSPAPRPAPVVLAADTPKTISQGTPLGRWLDNLFN